MACFRKLDINSSEVSPEGLNAVDLLADLVDGLCAPLLVHPELDTRYLRQVVGIYPDLQMTKENG
jgi:hypothetical protein